MRAAAPPTDFPLDRCSAALRLWRSALAGTALAVCVGWSAAWLPTLQDAAPAIAAAGLAVGAALSWLWQRRRVASRPTRLAWDGAQWLLRSDWRDAAGTPTVALDLGQRLLLRWQPAASWNPQWVWLRAADALPARWHLMRVALSATALPAPALTAP